MTTEERKVLYKLREKVKALNNTTNAEGVIEHEGKMYSTKVGFFTIKNLSIYFQRKTKTRINTRGFDLTTTK